MKICVIDDNEEGMELLGAVFAGADNVEISDTFSENSDITVYLSADDYVLENIRAGSMVILSSNRYVRTDVAVNVIICGLYEKATVTASSVSRSEDVLEFVYCLQRSLMTLDNKRMDIGEIKIKSDWLCLEKVLAAVTAGIMVFGNTEEFIELNRKGVKGNYGGKGVE